MGILSDLLFGGSEELHNDGSVTERFSDGTSITRNDDGTTREYTSHTTSLPFGIGEKVTVTKDEDGNTINVQRGWGK